MKWDRPCFLAPVSYYGLLLQPSSRIQTAANFQPNGKELTNPTTKLRRAVPVVVRMYIPMVLADKHESGTQNRGTTMNSPFVVVSSRYAMLVGIAKFGDTRTTGGYGGRDGGGCGRMRESSGLMTDSRPRDRAGYPRRNGVVQPVVCRNSGGMPDKSLKGLRLQTTDNSYELMPGPTCDFTMFVSIELEVTPGKRQVDKAW